MQGNICSFVNTKYDTNINVFKKIRGKRHKSVKIDQRRHKKKKLQKYSSTESSSTSEEEESSDDSTSSSSEESEVGKASEPTTVTNTDVQIQNVNPSMESNQDLNMVKVKD